MANIKLFKQDGSVNGEVTVNDEVFAIEPNEAAIFEVIMMHRASKRQGTHDVKNRGEVRGGGRKPWKQKGTGRARSGSNRSPIWVGGGVTFGPTPRSYSYSIPKKVRRLAIKSALSDKANNGNILAVEELNFDQPKTKDFQAFLTNIDANDKVLVVVEAGNDNAAKSARNLQNVTVVDENNVNTLDVVNHNKVIFTQAALTKVEEGLA